MLFKIPSHRGHHEAAVLEPEVSKALFEKLTGKRAEALPAEYREKMPENMGELERLWKNDTVLAYQPFEVVGENDLVPMKDFNPEVKEVLFLAPIVGG